MLSRILLALAVLTVVIPNAVAQSTEGEWNGRLECSAVFPGIRSLTPAAYGQAVRFHSSAGILSGSIDDAYSEQKLSGSNTGNRMMLVMDAKQKDRPVWWQTVLDGPVNQGVASLNGFLLAADGRTQVRRCSMTASSVAYAAQRRQMEAAQKAAAAKAVDDRVAAERAAQDRAAAADAAAQQRAEADRVSSEQAAAERLAAERLAMERRNADRAAAAARAKAVTVNPPPPQRADTRTVPKAGEQVSADKVEAEQLATEKAVAEKAAAEKVSAERATERAAAEKLASEREVAERATAERVLAEKAAAERAQRIAAEKAAAEKKSPIRARSSMDL